MVSGIDSIIKGLADDLQARIEAVIQLTEAREELEVRLSQAKQELKRVHIALEALNGSSIPIPITPEEASTSGTREGPILPSAEEPARPDPIPAPSRVRAKGPVCAACGGEMIYTSRSLNNGKTVNLWSCLECRNERF